MGYDPRFNYMKLVRAAHHLRDDSVLFLATDDDATFPLRDNMTMPGTRAVSIPIPKESQFLFLDCFLPFSGINSRTVGQKNRKMNQKGIVFQFTISPFREW